MNVVSQVSTETMVIVMLTLACLTFLCLALISLMFIHFKRLFALQNQHINIVREDLNAICNGTLGLGERVAILDTRLDKINKRQEHLEMQEAPERSFKQAIKMVSKGANIEELMSDCGLARGEAELVLLSKQLDRAV
jgi:hypothetical protein